MTVSTFAALTVDQHSWVDAWGVEHPFGEDTRGNRVHVTARQGFGAAPRSFTEDRFPNVAGTRHQLTTVDPRDLAMRCVFVGTSTLAYRGLIRSWILWLESGPGALKVFAGGEVRVIDCHYAGGLELDESRGNATALMQRAVISFRAFDPLFRAAEPEFVSFPLVTQQPFLPFLPMTVVQSTTRDAGVLKSRGDADAWPVWEVTGPGSNLVLTDVTNGRTLRWEGSLAAGETLTIDSRPEMQLVRYGNGASAYRFLRGDWWPVPPGETRVSLTLDNASAVSGLTVAYLPRYRSA